ncbi:MAG: MFS transporter, partial [Candidatus Heimdallarchaeota archaeon]
VSFNKDVDQGEVFGRLGSWASVGFFFGSVLTAILLGNNGESFRPLFLVAAVFSFLALSSSLFLDAETNLESNTAFASSNPRIPSFTMIKPILVIFVLVLFTQTSNALYVGFFAIFIENELGLNVNWVAIVNSTATIIGIAATYFIGQLLVKKFPKKHILNLGLIIYLLLPGLTFIFSNDFVIVFILYSIPAYATFFVVIPVIIAENTYDENRGFSMGLYSAFMFSGQAIGTLIGAYIASISGVIRYNFALSAAIALIAMFIGLFFYKETNLADHRKNKSTT